MRVSVTCPTIYTCQAESVFRTRLEYTAMKAIYRFDDTKSVETVKNNSLRRSRTRGRIHVSSTRVSTMFVTYIVFERRPSRSYSSVFTFHTINTTVVEYYRCERAIYITRLRNVRQFHFESFSFWFKQDRGYNVVRRYNKYTNPKIMRLKYRYVQVSLSLLYSEKKINLKN